MTAFSPAPGLLAAPQPDTPGAYWVIHETSGWPVIYGCAGEWTADSAARDLARLLDWTLTADAILETLKVSPQLVTAMERLAARWGATCYPGEPAQERVST